MVVGWASSNKDCRRVVVYVDKWLTPPRAERKAIYLAYHSSVAGADLRRRLSGDVWYARRIDFLSDLHAYITRSEAQAKTFPERNEALIAGDL